MTNGTNDRFVYTIEVTKWDRNLYATVDTIRTTDIRERNKWVKMLYEECKDEMLSGVIRDYHIIVYQHDTVRKTTYAK